MRLAAAVLLALATAAAARADVTGSWHVGFPDSPGGPFLDVCRFDLVESAGTVQGWLGICGLGTDGLVSGTVDAAGALSLHIVAPDDLACEVYGISATVGPTGDEITGTYLCAFPTMLAGHVTMTRCDPSTAGSCPETSGLSLPPRPHEVRACAPEPASPCAGSPGARARLTLARSDTFHYALTFTLPDAPGITVGDLGDPTTVRDFAACVYHSVDGQPVLAAMEPAWGATTCRTGPCWKVLRSGLSYRNRDADRSKLARIVVKVRPSGTTRVLVKGRATTVLPPPLGAAPELPITVQLLSDDTCVGATFPTGVTNAAGVLTASGGQ